VATETTAKPLGVAQEAIDDACKEVITEAFHVLCDNLLPDEKPAGDSSQGESEARDKFRSACVLVLKARSLALDTATEVWGAKPSSRRA
jgi:hypothetical protein